MLLNKICFLPLHLFFVSQVSSAAEDIVCPSRLHSQKQFVLASADIYVGPPELRTNLIPDLNTSTWDLTVEQNEARNRGESLYLVCRYQGTADVATLKIPFDQDRCEISREKAMLRIGCTRSSPKSDRKGS